MRLRGALRRKLSEIKKSYKEKKKFEKQLKERAKELYLKEYEKAYLQAMKQKAKMSAKTKVLGEPKVRSVSTGNVKRKFVRWLSTSPKKSDQIFSDAFVEFVAGKQKKKEVI